MTKKLEEAIKQTRPFRSAHQRATVNLLYTYNYVMEKIREILGPYDITIQQYNVLRIIKGAKGDAISTSDIRDRMVDKNSDTSRMVERLCKKGLIKKETCCNDKRRVDLCLSFVGETLIEEVSSLDYKFDGILKNLSAEEAFQLGELLDKIRD